MADAASTSLFVRAFEPWRVQRFADCAAVAVAVSLPWSTSATGILVVVWLLALLPTLGFASLRREWMTAAGGLPVALWLFAVLGMLWSDVSWAERVSGLGGFHKLLVIPLLLAQFRRSGRGMWVLYGFLASCALLLVASAITYVAGYHFNLVLVPNKMLGVPVKDYIAQSSEFLVCAFALLAFAFDYLRAGRVRLGIALAVLAALFLVDIYYVSPGRTALVVIPLLLAFFAFRYAGWKGLVVAAIAAAMLAAIFWASSPFLRLRINNSLNEWQSYQFDRADNPVTSGGLRLEFWKKSLGFIAEAPIFGHGTGSVREKFRSVATGTGASAFQSDNPHNQFLAVAISLGLAGGALLIAMWVAHLALFRGGGTVTWVGIVIVLQNIVSSQFNSHIFDFLHGWLYVFGVGVVGGMALRAAAKPPAEGAAR